MNFAAIEFVSKIDNAAFQLAANGFLGHTMQRRTLRVKKIAFAKNKKRCPLLIIQTAFLVNLVGLVSILVLVRMRQNSGYYYENGAGCGTLSVTFGPETFDLTTRLQYLGNNKTNNNIDEIPHMLQYSFFNGDYVVEFFDKSNRPVYYERGMMNKKAGKFYYCEAERSWVFTIPALRDVIPGKSNCPQGWLLQSPITDALTLEDVPLSQWHVIQGSGVLGKTSTTEFSIECAECKRNSDCSLNGVCSGGACDCDDAWTGQTCNIQRPFCEELSWVEYGDSSLNYTEIGPYKILKRESTTVEVYGMPVYHHVVDEDEFRIRNVSYNIISCEDNVVLFTGRVWYSFFWCRPLEELETFHAYWVSTICPKNILSSVWSAFNLHAAFLFGITRVTFRKTPPCGIVPLQQVKLRLNCHPSLGIEATLVVVLRARALQVPR